jgi:predicted nuclease of predicted toxin-antitoxin system
MGLSPRIAAWLRTCGHDVAHLRDEQLHRMPDADIFAKAVAEGRAILTFDLDFGEIVAATGSLRTSVVVFRLHDTRTETVIERLRDVLDQSSDALIAGAIVVVEDAQHRVRRLPFELASR